MRRAVVGGAARRLISTRPLIKPGTGLPIVGRRSRSAAAVSLEKPGYAQAGGLFSQYRTPLPPGYKVPEEYLVNVPETKVTTLENGFRVATERSTSNRETATVGVWVDAGSRYESDETNGVAHFLEHMAFKGTTKRSQYDLETEVENMGAHLNAYTSREQTVYYAKVSKDQVPKAVDILADILQNSVFDAASVNRERDVILREMEEVESHVSEFVFDQLHATAFQGSSLGRTILGAAENVARISREDCLNFIQTHYTAPRMVLAGAGAVDHDQLVALASKYFGKVATSAPAGAVTTYDPAVFVGSEVRVRNDDVPSINFAIAYPTVGWSHPDTYPLMVLQSILGAWDKNHWTGSYGSSSLVQKVAKEHLATRFYAFNTSYNDTGLFGFYAEADPDNDKVQDLVWSMMEDTVRCAVRPEEEEVIRAKNQLKANILTQLEHGSAETAEDIGRQLLTYGRRLPLAEVFARIDAVTPDTIARVGNQYIWDQDHAAASYGSVHNQNLPDYNWVRRRSFWIRY